MTNTFAGQLQRISDAIGTLSRTFDETDAERGREGQRKAAAAAVDATRTIAEADKEMLAQVVEQMLHDEEEAEPLVLRHALDSLYRLANRFSEEADEGPLWEWFQAMTYRMDESDDLAAIIVDTMQTLAIRLCEPDAMTTPN